MRRAMTLPRLILVGGFLGAGKTTLLAQAALRLSEAGNRVGLVANDQAADLVDSEIFRIAGTCVEEVAGGCFCCRFPDMIAALDRLAARRGGRPAGRTGGELHRFGGYGHAASQAAARRGVRCGPAFGAGRRQAGPRACRLSAEASEPLTRFPDNVLYIYEKQLEEADPIVLNKADSLAAGELADSGASLAARFPEKPLLTMSARTGEGVDAWLEWVAEQRPAGQYASMLTMTPTPREKPPWDGSTPRSHCVPAVRRLAGICGGFVGSDPSRAGCP